MEFNSTTVGIIILLLVFIPIIVLIVSASGKNKKTAKSFVNLVRPQGVEPKDIEVIGNLIIGFDDVSGKLVYTSKINPSADLKIVDITTVKDCRVKTIKHEETMDWVGLELLSKTGREEIPFYLETDETGLSRDPLVCVQHAKKWESRIRPLLLAS